MAPRVTRLMGRLLCADGWLRRRGPEQDKRDDAVAAADAPSIGRLLSARVNNQRDARGAERTQCGQSGSRRDFSTAPALKQSTSRAAASFIFADCAGRRRFSRLPPPPPEQPSVK